MKELQEALKQPKAPAMPVVATSPEDMAYAARSFLGIHGKAKGKPNCKKVAAQETEKPLKEFKRDYWHLFAQAKFSSSAGGNSHSKHVERVAPRGHASEEWFACVHTPLPIPKAMQIPEAREAMN